MLVVDASVLVVALADDGADGDTARAALAGTSLAAPEIIDLEVLSVLRRQLSGGRLDPRRAELALADLPSFCSSARRTGHCSPAAGSCGTTSRPTTPRTSHSPSRSMWSC